MSHAIDFEYTAPQVQSTTEYSLFRFTATNRKISQYRVKELRDSIRVENHLHLRPILVNDDMEVIDGQHRLCAAAGLGVPIYYQVCHEINETSLELLNKAAHSWSNEDWIEHYANRRIIPYVNLREFCREHGLVPSAALVYSGRGFVAPGQQTKAGTISSGELEFYPTMEDMQRLGVCRAIAETVDDAILKQRIWHNRSFHACVWEVMRALDREDNLLELWNKNGIVIGQPTVREQFLAMLLKAVNVGRNKSKKLRVMEDEKGYPRVVKGSVYRSIMEKI